MRLCLTIAVVVLLVGVTIYLRRNPGTLKLGAWESSESLWSQMIEGDVLKIVQIKTDGNWRRLSLSEYEAIIAELAKRQQVDVERGQLKNHRLLLDPWGSRYEIALRKDETQRVHAVVWSIGPDRASGTGDDIVYPSDQTRLPSNLNSTRQP